MPDSFFTLGVAAAAALASPIGGLIALRRAPTSLILSLSVGFAAGVLLGTICFEMLPKALEKSSAVVAALGFVCGFAAVYGLDLYINRGQIAGEKAEQRPRVERYHARHHRRGDEVTVLGGATSTEEIIEGLSIGIGAAIEPSAGVLIGAAIFVDNLAEALSIGELVQNKRQDAWRVMKWTGLIGLSLFSSALFGWLFLGSLPGALLGFLFASGAGGMFYLVMTDLVPDSAEWNVQQSGAIAVGLGFLLIFLVTAFV